MPTSCGPSSRVGTWWTLLTRDKSSIFVFFKSTSTTTDGHDDIAVVRITYHCIVEANLDFHLFT